jgi:hypothetical protein
MEYPFYIFSIHLKLEKDDRLRSFWAGMNRKMDGDVLKSKAL